jgi:serine/threonine protein kinase
MSYCFNPYCSEPSSFQLQDECNSCGASLLLNKRYRGIKLLGKSQLALTIEVSDIEPNQLEPGNHNSNTKVLKILLTDYPKALELFQQEARILAQMNHVGIPKLSGDGYFSFQPQWQPNPVHCLVIEKITGLDLEQWLKQRANQPISLQKAQAWLKQLLDIISQLHQQQYFHRDIKPSNIILQPNGKLALIDFGAARKVTTTYLGKVGVNQGVTSIGTPGYIAPEQIDGAALPQSDFFGLGRTLIHLLTGKHPQELAKNLDTGEIIWREQASQVSASFADLLDSMINPLPSKRPVNVTLKIVRGKNMALQLFLSINGGNITQIWHQEKIFKSVPVLSSLQDKKAVLILYNCSESDKYSTINTSSSMTTRQSTYSNCSYLRRSHFRQKMVLMRSLELT